MMQFLIRSVLKYVKYHDFCNLDVYASTCNIEISPLVLPQEKSESLCCNMEHAECPMDPSFTSTIPLFNDKGYITSTGLLYRPVSRTRMGPMPLHISTCSKMWRALDMH